MEMSIFGWTDGGTDIWNTPQHNTLDGLIKWVCSQNTFFPYNGPLFIAQATFTIIDRLLRDSFHKYNWHTLLMKTLQVKKLMQIRLFVASGDNFSYKTDSLVLHLFNCCNILFEHWHPYGGSIM